LDDRLAIIDARLAGVLAPHGGTVRHGLRLGRDDRSVDVRAPRLGLPDPPVDPRYRGMDRVRQTEELAGRRPFGADLRTDRAVVAGDVDSEFDLDDEGVDREIGSWLMEDGFVISDTSEGRFCAKVGIPTVTEGKQV
jgi:hypothetical protein